MADQTPPRCEMPGPVPPRVDLRGMLRHYVIGRCLDALAAGEARRRQAGRDGAWPDFCRLVRARVAAQMGPMPKGPPLHVRALSRRERAHFVLENVLFDSLPGWEVNASVFLPGDTPPPWPAIVVPLGHSDKQSEDHQLPPQAFARCGFAAVTFDPPGQSGEKQPGNDHFRDGVRCYLTGESSNRYFVADALRCVDYMASRPDVDSSRGIAMTGVSGGGQTTMFAALLDGRIAVAGPVCCGMPLAEHPVLDCYAACPETLPIGRIADGIGETDLFCALMPRPLFLAAGKADEVFLIAAARRLAHEVHEAYGAAGHGDRFAFLEAAGGHAYTTETALEFVRWVNRWMLGDPGRPVPRLSCGDLEMLPAEMLRCSPSPEPNIFTLTRDRARELKAQRPARPSRETLRAAVRNVVHAPETLHVPEAQEGPARPVWMVACRELMLRPEPGIELPATMLCDARPRGPQPAVLHLDDRRRWLALERHGIMARAAGFIDRGRAGRPVVLTVDLRGWGDTAPACTPYDMAGWSGLDRWMCYVSAALGDHVMAMRVRDAAAALAYLASRPEVDPARVALSGRGLGGVVALCAAFLAERIRAVVTMDMPASFQELLESPRYTWSQDAFLAGALTAFDLPELAGALGCPVLLANPLDAMGDPLPQERAAEVYADARAANPFLEVRAGLAVAEAEQAVIVFLAGL